MTNFRAALVSICALAGALGAAGESQAASGYGVGQESVVGVGNAHSGGAAAAGDASTVWYNPAGMMRFNDPRYRYHLMVGGVLIVPSVDYDERRSVLADGVTPVTGNEAGDAGVIVGVPNVYAIWNYADDVKFGLGINAPWGLKTKYNSTWLGRYSETSTDLKTFNVNPSIAWRMNERWSFGGGLNYQYADARLVQAIDFGSVCVANLGAGACAGLGLNPQGADGLGDLDVHDSAFGYNIGALFDWSPHTRFGLHYRSKLDYDFDGNVSYAVPAAAQAILQAGQFVHQRAKTKLTIPETLSLSAYHDIDDRWSVTTDVTWTDWSVFKELRVRATPTPDNVLRTEWNPAFRYAIGLSYRWDQMLTLRGGAAFDESPISDAFRGPGIPDSDRWVLGLGASIGLTDGTILDLGYQYVHFVEGSTRRISATNSLLVGKFDVDAHIFGLGARWAF